MPAQFPKNEEYHSIRSEIAKLDASQRKLAEMVADKMLFDAPPVDREKIIEYIGTHILGAALSVKSRLPDTISLEDATTTDKMVILSTLLTGIYLYACLYAGRRGFFGSGFKYSDELLDELFGTSRVRRKP